jgi:hypothetical protein
MMTRNECDKHPNRIAAPKEALPIVETDPYYDNEPEYAVSKLTPPLIPNLMKPQYQPAIWNPYGKGFPRNIPSAY